MGFFDFFKKKKREYREDTYDSDEMSLDFEDIDFMRLSPEERARYVTDQCEIIQDCNNSVESAKKEYKIISSYFSDIQIIESQSPKVRDQITYLARSILEITDDRNNTKAIEKKLSGSRYMQILAEEDTIVDTIKNLKNNEIYLQVVKKDMSALNGEKESLRIESGELLVRQKIIKNITIVSMVCFAIIFCVLIFAGEVSEVDYSTFFYVVLLLAALFAVGVMTLYQRTVYNTKLTELKLNKAIALHNKVKIKYINVKNLIDYQYDKYGIKNAYELSDIYQRFLETKANQERYHKATVELTKQEEDLMYILKSLGLYDADIWLSQIRALADPKEMVEIRHNYSVRRQALRKYIEEQGERAEESKALLRGLITDYPGHATEVLKIVENYN